MKIFMLCDYYNEALEYQENLLVKYYRKQGHAVTVVASTFDSVFDYYNDKHDKSLPMRIYEDRGARIIKLPYRYNIFNRLRAYIKIDKLLDDAKPDLIYVHDIMLNLPECVRYVRNHPQCKMILDYHADYSNSGNSWLSRKILHGIVRKRFLDQARPHLARIFPIVPASATFLHEVYGIPHAEMELLPLGADTDLGRQVRQQGARVRLRSAHGLDDQDCVIFTGGKLDPLKRTEDLIDAVVATAAENVVLMIIGDSPPSQPQYRQMLERRAAGSKNVRFVGWQKAKAVYEYLDMADIAIFPASQSILWQQAISMGLPLIVGERSAAAAQLQDVSYLNGEDNIIVLQAQSPMVDELKYHIVRLAGDRSERQRMSAGARLVTERMLNWNTLIDRTLRFNSSGSASLDSEVPGADPRPAIEALS